MYTLIDTYQAPYGVLLLARSDRQLVMTQISTHFNGDVESFTKNTTQKEWLELTGGRESDFFPGSLD